MAYFHVYINSLLVLQGLATQLVGNLLLLTWKEFEEPLLSML